jgi:uracil-DNA glycosylase
MKKQRRSKAKEWTEKKQFLSLVAEIENCRGCQLDTQKKRMRLFLHQQENQSRSGVV